MVMFVNHTACSVQSVVMMAFDTSVVAGGGGSGVVFAANVIGRHVTQFAAFFQILEQIRRVSFNDLKRTDKQTKTLFLNVNLTIFRFTK